MKCISCNKNFNKSSFDPLYSEVCSECEKKIENFRIKENMSKSKMKNNLSEHKNWKMMPRCDNCRVKIGSEQETKKYYNFSRKRCPPFSREYGGINSLYEGLSGLEKGWCRDGLCKVCYADKNHKCKRCPIRDINHVMAGSSGQYKGKFLYCRLCAKDLGLF